MSTSAATTQRVVIVGGGIAGLSAAVRLVQAGFPVTLLEASALGSAASTRNQGWLHSGAAYALDHPDYARLCYAALQQTLAFCPDCVEPGVAPMAYLFSRPDVLIGPWSAAWAAAGIPCQELSLESVFAELPALDRTRVLHAFELPDRSIRTDVLLTHLAAAAQNAGVEIRTATTARTLGRHGGRVHAVVTTQGEEIAARLVILAGGAPGYSLCREYRQEMAGSQLDVELVPLKTHLVAAEPEVGRRPFCIPDAGGFNHLPHPPASVFGSGQWERAGRPDDQATDPAQVDMLWKSIHRFFPKLAEDSIRSHAWAGTMMQAMQFDQIAPGAAIWPAVVDHALQAPHVENLLSIFPGRATLWSRLAEDTRKAVLAKLDFAPQSTALPPWRTP